MLIEVAVLQRFVLLLGHPVYSLTVTLFSLVLGTGLGAASSHRFPDNGLRRTGAIALGLPMPTGLRMLNARAPQMLPWAWGINGALSVVGATLAIFIAMNWGFNTTLLAASGTYAIGLWVFLSATRRQD